MTKICTTIEQSKRLIELGIDVNTADMCYIREQWFEHDENEIKEDWSKYPVVDFDEDEDKVPLPEPITYPCWSLAALLELMPSRINATYKLNLIKDDTTNGYYYNYTDRKERKLRTSFVSRNSLDAAFEMVCWLLENKKI